MPETPTPSDRETDDEYFHNPNSALTASQLLNSGFPLLSAQPRTPISRGQSLSDLAGGSTLAGIYSQADEEEEEEEDTRFDFEQAWVGRPTTPPAHRPTVKDVEEELERARLERLRLRPNRRRSTMSNFSGASMASPSGSLSSVTLAAGVLFALGVGYGLLLSRLQDGSRWRSLTEGIAFHARWNLPYLVFWGVAGVVLGALLPWFDRVWEDKFGGEEGSSAIETEQDGSVPVDEQCSSPSASSDWTLIMRAIGAFVGIVFALRKLAWSSTLQVSISLALVNPLLWWIIDRSAAGLIVSGAVGFTGSAVLLGVNPQLMPAPSRLLRMHAEAVGGGGAAAAAANGTTGGYMLGDDLQGLLPGQGAAHETLETGVWMLSVLFCSCVCFGNIGRRLAWNKTADVKGRWGGLQ